MPSPSEARSVETLITALQRALAPLPIRSALKQDVLYLTVELPPKGLFNSSMVLHRVAGQLEGPPVQGIGQLVVYGRLQGEAQPRWKKVFCLSSGESSVAATQIVLPGGQVSEIQVLEAQKPVLDPAGNADFRNVKTLEAQLAKALKKPEPASSVQETPLQTQAPIPVPPSFSLKVPANLLGQQWQALRPFLGGALALSLLLGIGLVARGQADVRSRAGSLGVGIPLLILAVGGGWWGWRSWRLAAASGSRGSSDPFAEGLALLQADRIPEAMERFHEAARRQPDHAEAHVELAHLLAKTNRLQEALSHYQQAKRLNPNLSGLDTHLVETLKALARQGLAQHQPDAVLAYLSEALPLARGAAQAEIFSLLGQAWAEKGDWAQALIQYQRAVGLDPHLSEAHLCIARLHLRLKQWDEAVDSCWAALELDNRWGLAHYLMGQALMRKGQLKAAVAAFQTALSLDLDPELAAAVRVDLGLAMVHAGRLSQASQEFSQVLLSSGSSKLQQSRAYYGLGLVLAAQEQHNEAIKSYQRALGLVPNLPEAVAAIGLSYLGQKHRDASGRKFVRPQQVQEAVQQFEQALREDPDLPEAHFGLGEAFRIQGELSSAVASYQRAIRSNGSYGLAHYRLGSVFARQGKLDQAIDHFRRALEIYPDFPEAKGRLQRLLSKQTEEMHTNLLPL